MKLYKLTDAEGRTGNEMQWGVGITNHAAGKGVKLCSSGVIHAYTSLLLAELMDLAHGSYGACKLAWEADGEVVSSDGTKVGCKSLTTICEVTNQLPILTRTQRTAFAILSAQEVLLKTNVKWLKWHKWAEQWLDGTDWSLYDAASDAAADAASAAASYAAYAAAAADAASYAAAAYADMDHQRIDFEALAQRALTFRGE